MIKIDQNWTITKDSFQWVLTYEAEGEVNPKTGKPSKTVRTTYHSTLAQVLRHFADDSLVVNSVPDLQRSLGKVHEEIKALCIKVGEWKAVDERQK